MIVTEETLDDIQQQAAEVITAGRSVGGIIISPQRLKKIALFVKDKYVLHHDPKSPCGWSIFGLPVYRCWEIPGPVVVSGGVLDALLKCGRVEWPPQFENAMTVSLVGPETTNPILF